MKAASEKQIEFGRKIAKTLSIELPSENTAQAYYLFIHENIYRYKQKAYDIERIDDTEEPWFCPFMDTF